MRAKSENKKESDIGSSRSDQSGNCRDLYHFEVPKLIKADFYILHSTQFRKSLYEITNLQSAYLETLEEAQLVYHKIGNYCKTIGLSQLTL